MTPPTRSIGEPPPLSRFG
ncbi:TPA: hypothetical protein N0F65_006606 [Lagenidium giganteum]|uniref:Uncharacterized protein n=1 Tax=Lagenidium giganteum TaxID=4803 RepID=A0AAV2Z636_9STRA|nr:TPA: hypothetical protein N0F65_006606 [Lagenidium giganteum]